MVLMKHNAIFELRTGGYPDFAPVPKKQGIHLAGNLM
jgi:hypothetical protein